MTEIRYCDLVVNASQQQVQGIGTSTNDGWSSLGGLPMAGMPTGARQYVVLVQGKIAAQVLAGTGATRGRAEVRLGTRAGTRHPDFLVTVPVVNVCNAGGGIPFQFMFVVTAGVADSLFGTSMDLSTNELCLWARTYTNSDAQTYYHEFQVSDVTWLWWDITSIPSGHSMVHEEATLSDVPVSLPATWQLVTPTFGAAAQRWLHFSNVHYRATIPNNYAARFQLGISADGTTSSIEPKIGTVRWGQNRSPYTAPGAAAHCQQGAWWSHVNAGATTRAGLRSVEQGGPLASSGSTRVKWRHFAVRIDTLLDLFYLRLDNDVDLAILESQVAAWTAGARTIERPAQGIMTEPIVMLHGANAFVAPQLIAYGARVFENEDNTMGLREGVFPEANSAVLEGVSSMVFGRRVFQTTSQAIQWRAVFVGYPGTPTTPQNVNDIEFLTFHPVRDPENVTTPPGGAPTPIVVVPATQSLDAGALAAPPVVPNAGVQERPMEDRPSIDGVSGYRRRWPLGVRFVRMFNVSWGPLSENDAQAVFDFLVENRTWQYTPPRQAAVAVLSMEAPAMRPDSHRTFTVEVEVAELRWTGP